MIDSNRHLDSWLAPFRQAPWIAIDTEADSLHAYPEKLCLIQIGIPEEEVLVDPLGEIDLSPLWRVLKRHELIIHGADYDLRLLQKSGGFVPDAIFDTMLAARLVGHRQFGLNDLVFRFLGIQLEKGPQKANWARRPLTPRMENYALNDVRFLPRLAKGLKKELEEKGRLAWHKESCDRLISDCTIPRSPDPDLVWRVKGSHQLSPRALAVLREIWQWREKEAVRSNKPPYFILQPSIMIDLALAAAETSDVDQRIPPRLTARRKHGLKDAIKRGVHSRHLPGKKKRTGRRPDEAEKQRFRDLEIVRDKAATDLDIDATLIASRATLVALARDPDEQSRELMNWQRELLKL